MAKSSSILFFMFALTFCAPNSKVEMISFYFINERDFEMCFNRDVKGNFSIVMKTKSGKEMKKEGVLISKKIAEDMFCFQGQKMQYTYRAYSEAERVFYSDSLTNTNIRSIDWKLYRDNFGKDVYAEGYFVKENK